LTILAVETSGEHCSVALSIKGQLYHRDAASDQRQSGLLIDMIQALLSDCRVLASELNGIAYGCGPGSFTGLRVACGVVQGIAAGLNLPVVGIPTLTALAHQATRDRVVCCIDARMKEVYHAAFERVSGTTWKVVMEPAVYSPESLPTLPGKDWHGLGNGFAAYEPALQALYGAQLSSIDKLCYPHAKQVAQLSEPIFAAGGGGKAEEASLLYVRDKVALTIHERSLLKQ